MTAKNIHLALTALGDPDIAAHSIRFFKTGHGIIEVLWCFSKFRSV